jgi:hypothetical protein
MDAAEKKSAWMGFASSALAGMTAAAAIDASDVDDDTLNETVELACSYADAMLIEFEDRFVASKRGRGRRRASREEEPEEEEPEEEEEEDD